MRDYVNFFNEASVADKATFADGFLAAMRVYNLFCPEEDDPNDHETQSWVISEVYRAQMEHELERRQRARMLMQMQEASWAKERGMTFGCKPLDNAGSEIRVDRQPNDYSVSKYDVIAMLMDCAHADESGNEVDQDGKPVAYGAHQPWPHVVYHHKEDGSELSREEYNTRSDVAKMQYRPIKYIELSLSSHDSTKTEKICEDSYRLLELVDWLIEIGDPINERLLRHKQLIDTLRERFDYDLPGKIMDVMYNRPTEGSCSMGHAAILDCGGVSIITGR